MTTATSSDDRLFAYLDGELDGSEKAAFEAELSADAALRAEVDGLKATLAFVGDEMARSASEGLDDPPPHLFDAILHAEKIARAASIKEAAARRHDSAKLPDAASSKDSSTAGSGWRRWLFGFGMGGGALVGAAALVLFVSTKTSMDTGLTAAPEADIRFLSKQQAPAAAAASRGRKGKKGKSARSKAAPEAFALDMRADFDDEKAAPENAPRQLAQDQLAQGKAAPEGEPRDQIPTGGDKKGWEDAIDSPGALVGRMNRSASQGVAMPAVESIGAGSGSAEGIAKIASEDSDGNLRTKAGIKSAAKSGPAKKPSRYNKASASKRRPSPKKLARASKRKRLEDAPSKNEGVDPFARDYEEQKSPQPASAGGATAGGRKYQSKSAAPPSMPAELSSKLGKARRKKLAKKRKTKTDLAMEQTDSIVQEAESDYSSKMDLVSAQREFRRKRYRSALALYDAAAANDSRGNLGILPDVGRMKSFEKLKMCKQALAVFQALQKKGLKTPGAVDAWWVAARCAADSGDKKRAAALYKDLEKIPTAKAKARAARSSLTQ